MHRILLAALLFVATDGAHAGDFTGFYAGINAGYARGHEHDRTTGESPSLAIKPDAALPPSARDAALTLRPTQSGRTASPPGR